MGMPAGRSGPQAANREANERIEPEPSRIDAIEVCPPRTNANASCPVAHRFGAYRDTSR